MELNKPLKPFDDAAGPVIPLDAQTPTLKPGQIRLMGSEEAFAKLRPDDAKLANVALRGPRPTRRQTERYLKKKGITVQYGPPLLDFTQPGKLES